MERYVDVIKEKGLKVTSARLQILKYLDNHRTHPTAAEIYGELKKKNPSLSQTTVYNNLDTLDENGVLQVLTISPNEKRYDINCEMHHHFLCEECGKIMDIDVQCKFLDEMLEGEHRVDEVHGYFKGVCKDCLKKKGKKRG